MPKAENRADAEAGPREAELEGQARLDVIRYLRSVMNNRRAPVERRDRAASRLAAIVGDAAATPAGGRTSAPKAKGLKEQRQEDAQSLIEAGSPFVPSAPPRLN